MNVVVCALAKKEHKYIDDWVKWYLSIGVDKIFLFDNDELGYPYIGDYITNKESVEIIDVRGIVGETIQTDFYNRFYGKYGDTFDWCLFVDIDEFLQVDDIHEFLSNDIYNDYEQIRVMWKLFGDDDLIERDESLPVYKAFVKPVKKSYSRDLVHKGNLELQGKCIVKGHLKDIVFGSVHYASRNCEIIKSCLPDGTLTNSKVVIKEPYNSSIYLNHYMTKTLKEFIEQKLNRSDAVYGYNLKINYFWRINTITYQKMLYLKNKGII